MQNNRLSLLVVIIVIMFAAFSPVSASLACTSQENEIVGMKCSYEIVPYVFYYVEDNAFCMSQIAANMLQGGTLCLIARTCTCT